MKRDEGFTLIELLVAIGILLVLAAMMVGGLNAAKRKARRTRARAEIHQLATAWINNLSDYSRFPSDTITEMNRDACLILRGRHRGHNSKGVPYMDFHHETRGFRDPWGTFYQVELDRNMDGKVTVAGEEIRRTVAVWSTGSVTNGANMDADDICSWKER